MEPIPSRTMRLVFEGMGAATGTRVIGSGIGHAQPLLNSRSQDQWAEAQAFGLHAAEKEKHERTSEPCQSDGTDRRNPITEKE